MSSYGKWLFPSILAAALGQSAAGFAQVSVVPANPNMNDTVRVKIAPLPMSSDNFDPRNRRITMSGNKITVQIGGASATFVILPPPTIASDIAIGQFPAGTYEVEVRTGLGAETTSVGSASFVVSESKPADPVQSNTDIWWNPNESGWGLNVIQHGSGIIFATWFNYAADGRPIWYVMPRGQWARGVEYRGPIYRTTGREVAATFDPSLVTVTLVGEGVLTFNPYDFNRMTAALTVDGRTVTKELQRQGF